MPAVIQRVVTSPTVRTEYLSQVEPPKWSAKKDEAWLFETHGQADQLAGMMREQAQRARRESGQIDAAFIHARNVSASELHEYTPAATHRRRKPRGSAVDVPPVDATRLHEVELEEAYL